MENQENTGKSKNKTWLIYGLIMLVIFGASLALRVVPMFQAVFGGDQINLQGVDGVYHIRLVENLLAHFPFRITFDPYTYFPYGQDVQFAPLFDYLAGLCAWIVGLGSPSQQTIQTVAAYFPAVLGALITIPVYFIGKFVFNRVAGVIGAALIGVFPGTLLFRSRMGFFDHHVAEILFSTLVIMFLVITLKYVKEHPVSFSSFRNPERKALIVALVLAGLTGLMLGLYLMVWVGALLFVFLIFCWLVLMFVIEHVRKQPVDYLCIIGVPLFLVALVIVAPFLSQIVFSELYIASLVIGLFGALVLTGISRLLVSRNLAPLFYPLIMVGSVVVAIIVLAVFLPDLAEAIRLRFRIFTPDENALTVAEVRPMFLNNGKFTLTSIWGEFNSSVITAPVAFIMLCVSCIRKIEPWKLLLIVWSILVLTATAGQIRFTTYLAVVVALLSAYFFAEICRLIQRIFSRMVNKTARTPIKAESHGKHAGHKKTRPAEAHPAGHASQAGKHDAEVKPDTAPSGRQPGTGFRIAAICLGVILVFFAGIFPSIKPAIANAGSSAGINSEWQSALSWMKSNTPEPFQDPDFYYARYDRPADGRYPYPASAYGVLAWWDYGHMITQVAHRIPNANPYQAGAQSAAEYFVAQNENEANLKLDQLGTRYIMIDLEIAVPYSVNNNTITGRKYYAMATWAGTAQSEFCEIYYQAKDNRLYPVPVYYPEYYYSLVARLYNFDGQAVKPSNSSTVISYEVESGRRVIKDSRTFTTYEDADQYLKQQTTGNYRIVGLNPFSSPVPLEKLEHYQMVYQSPSVVTYENKRVNSSYIEIFEYLK